MSSVSQDSSGGHHQRNSWSDQAGILLAEGAPLKHFKVNISDQSSMHLGSVDTFSSESSSEQKWTEAPLAATASKLPCAYLGMLSGHIEAQEDHMAPVHSDDTTITGQDRPQLVAPVLPRHPVESQKPVTDRGLATAAPELHTLSGSEDDHPLSFTRKSNTKADDSQDQIPPG